MTNYNAWEGKANRLVQEADEEDEKDKSAADKALGLEGGPKGPPTEKAEKEMKELGEKSEERKGFIDWQSRIQNEAKLTHNGEAQPVELRHSDVEGRSVRLSGSEDTTYIFPEGLTIKKLTLDKCRRVVVRLRCAVPTSTVEVYACDDVEVDMARPIGTVQADECARSVRLRYAEYDHVGLIYHQNCPGLSIAWGVDGGDVAVGREGQFQLSTRRHAGSAASSGELVTQAVLRGEGEFPLELGGATAEAPRELPQPEPELAPLSDLETKRKLAEARREKGNEMFRASDFLQAAMEYSMALELDPSLDVVWANRAQCWLKTGDHEKALNDSLKCIEVNPLNSKGWFRKGMSLHAQAKHAEACPALLEAEKLEPKNEQIQTAVKMAQLMARKLAAA